MIDISNTYDEMVVRVTSPDGFISGKCDNYGRMQIWIDPEDAYYDYSAYEISKALNSVLRAMETSRQDTIRALHQKAGKRSLDLMTDHWDARRRRFNEAFRNTNCFGLAPSGVVDIVASGVLNDIYVDVDSEIFNTMEYHEFLSEFHQAYKALIGDFRRKRRILRRKYLDL